MPPASETKRQRYSKLVAALKNERNSFDAHWRELSEFIKPRRTRFMTADRNRGDRRNSKIIDSSATYAARTLSSGMMSGVTSPARPWFRLTTPDPDLAEFGPVKDWLHTVTRRMQTVFLRSNWYNALPTVYGDMGVFGTAAMLMVEDDESVIRCYPFAVGSYYLSNDAKLRVRVFCREFQMTVRQIVEQFGTKPNSRAIDWSNISDRVKTAWDNGNYEDWIDVTHVIRPNTDYDGSRIESKYKPFVQCYYEGAGNAGNPDDKFLNETGFDEFPVLAPRWEVTGEDVYGTDCPGMTALGDIKGLQLMKKFGLQAVEKQVKPPMVAPPEMRTAKLSILPGDVSYVAESQHRTFRAAHDVALNLNDLRQETAEVRQLIRRAFFEDLFLLLSQLDDQDRTATEIMERKEEKLLVLGPVLEQLNQDALDPGIDRAFNAMVRKGQVPDPPPDMEGMDLKVEYISIMAQAQKMVGLGGLERFSLFVTNMLAATPNDTSLLDKVDRDQLIDEYGEMTGVPPRVIVPDEQVAEIRQARAQAAKAQQAAEQIATVAPAAKQLSETDVSGDNALTALLGAGEMAGV
jgi:hypothetical protein